jgi:thiamine-monophosphate kinase
VLVSRPADDEDLVVVIDTLVAGVHFPEATPPRDVGYKSLAVNLSDLAAMGALPRAASASLTTSDEDARWLADFTAGYRDLAERHAMTLTTPTITRGHLCISVEALGTVPRGAALTRGGARPGDAIFVTGTLGDAGLALAATEQRITLTTEARAFASARLSRPEPRVEAGLRLRGVASAAIDISDGLCADLGHVLTASGVGATVDATQLPLSAALAGSVTEGQARQLALTAGDDYELCFTVPTARIANLEKQLGELACGLTRIGGVTQEPGLRVVDADGNPVETGSGYRHFP